MNSFHCDTSPYCDTSCEEYDAPVEVPSGDDDGVFETGYETCSFGPGLTVPCDVDLKEATFRFVVDEYGITLAEVREGSTTHKTCSLGPGRTVPCDVKGPEEMPRVFVCGG